MQELRGLLVIVAAIVVIGVLVALFGYPMLILIALLATFAVLAVMILMSVGTSASWLNAWDCRLTGVGRTAGDCIRPTPRTPARAPRRRLNRCSFSGRLPEGHDIDACPALGEGPSSVMRRASAKKEDRTLFQWSAVLEGTMFQRLVPNGFVAAIAGATIAVAVSSSSSFAFTLSSPSIAEPVLKSDVEQVYYYYRRHYYRYHRHYYHHYYRPYYHHYYHRYYHPYYYHHYYHPYYYHRYYHPYYYRPYYYHPYYYNPFYY